VTEATDGAEALARASAAREVDVLVSDIVMSRVCGRELRAVKTSHSADLLRRGLEDGVMAFLEKPFLPDDLVRAVPRTIPERLSTRPAFILVDRRIHTVPPA
jgi:CheY-like chemotaxis protein